MYSFYSLRASSKNCLTLKFYKRINNKNVQGCCGILTFESEEKVEDDESIDCRELIAACKTSFIFYKYGNNGYNCTLARQEYIVSNNLLNTCSHFPNFLRPIVYSKNNFVNKTNLGDPFFLKQISKQKLACVDVIFFEYLQCIGSLWDVLVKPNISKTFLNSLILQICCAILAAQQNANFVHNDLHANNILIIKCEKNLKIVYRLLINGIEKIYVVPTFGYIPVIIDYGYSYSSDCINMSLECCDSDNYGLITYQYDELSDFIRFFTIIYCSSYNSKLKTTIYEMFKDLPISLKNSWEKICSKNSNLCIEKIFKQVNKNLCIADKSEPYLLYQITRLFCRLITLPIKQNYNFENDDFEKINNKFEKELTIFLQEWSKINMWLKYEYEKVFIFRELIDAIRKHKKNYEEIAKILHQKLFEITNTITPLNLDYTTLINSAIFSSELAECMLYEKINSLDRLRKKIIYQKLKSSDKMFNKIENIIYNKPSLNKTDYLLLIDNVTKTNALINLDKDFQTYEEKDIFKIFLNCES